VLLGVSIICSGGHDNTRLAFRIDKPNDVAAHMLEFFPRNINYLLWELIGLCTGKLFNNFILLVLIDE